MNYRLLTLNLFNKVINYVLSVMKQNLVLPCMFVCVFCFYSAKADKMKAVEGSDDQIDSLLKKVELIPIMINGDKDNRINIVLMNRWSSGDKEPYNSTGMRGEFIKDINESLIAALTPGDERAQTAYASYREFFNVYGLWYPETPEWNKGINGDMVDDLRDRLFLPWKDPHTGWVTFLVMPNRDSGGGGAARNLEKRVGTALIAGNGIGKMLHEIAHTCMSIGDEYTAEGTGTSAFPTYTVEKEYRRDKIKWRKWIEPDTPLPTPYKKEYLNVVGAFEGAQYHLTDYFRSTAQGCIMGAGIFDNTEKMCPVCEQRVAMRVNALVNPLTSFVPENTVVEISGKTNLHFKINYIRPVPNTQIVRWILNGKTIATGPDEIDIELGDLDQYELICTLTDETPYIRPDPPFASFPKREITWKITNSLPVSNAMPLVAEIVRITDNSGRLNLESRISGGIPPYNISWSNGSGEKDLKNVGPGMYYLSVFDSEYRNSSSKHQVNFSEIKADNKTGRHVKSYQTKSTLNIKADVTAPEKGKQNGKIFLKTEGGEPPYSYVWSDEKPDYGEGIIYEAENAEVNIPGHILSSYDHAGNQAFISFGSNEGSIKWAVDIVRAGIYPVDLIYGGISAEVTPMEYSVNGIRDSNPLMFYATRPLLTGWDQVTVMCELQEGKNTIEVYSKGNSGVNFDYLRVPCNYISNKFTGSERWNLPPGDYSVSVTDQNNFMTQKSFTLNEVYPIKINSIEFKNTASGAVAVKDPLKGYEYNWYRSDIPLFIEEQYEMPLFTGVEFFPPAPGNYYVSVKDKLTHAESTNRFCLGVGKTEGDKKTGGINPDRLEGKINLWFDSADLDGDGNKDMITPERGPLKEWKAKTWRNPGKIFAKYKPNVLNGMGVCGFDNVWVSKLGIDSMGFQTVILVYRESSMSQDNTSPFRELNKYIGSADTGKQFFDPEKTDKAIINGKVYLNSINIDPFATPNPMEFCILTVEFDSEVKEGISIVEGNWEGDIAEMIFIKGLLTEAERQGVEEHLRKKWFSAYDLEFKKIDANVRL